MAFGALIWLSIILMPTLNSLAGSFYNDNHVFFVLETVCVMAFAMSSILKGHGPHGECPRAGWRLPASLRPARARRSAGRRER
jgi:hypothetical protein